MTPQIWFIFVIGFSIWSGVIGFFLGRWYEAREDIRKMINDIKNL